MVKIHKKAGLVNIFKSLQNEMMHRLSQNREIISHPTEKGTNSELDWINWLKFYLPQRYSVDRAFVIDSNDNQSEQLDIVIYDRQYSPFVFQKNETKYIPAESVYAVFEVKQDINNKNLKYAGKKIESVRRLIRTSAPIVHAGGNITKPKKPFYIIGGFLCLENSWKTKFGREFKASLKSLTSTQQINIGCVLKSGFFSAKYSPIKITQSSDDHTLITFFMTLLFELQQLGTVPAIDIPKYLKQLEIR